MEKEVIRMEVKKMEMEMEPYLGILRSVMGKEQITKKELQKKKRQMLKALVARDEDRIIAGILLGLLEECK